MMKKNFLPFIGLKLCLIFALSLYASLVNASSHREAPLISNDPLADNTDVYAFKSPDDTSTVTIIANYIPGESPDGGPNYYNFGTNIRYEIHIKNDAATIGDDITYRFTFSQVDEDSTTFFNIRLGKQNLKTTYVLEKSIHGGVFSVIVPDGIVPPYNIGPRSIGDATVGLNTPDYNTLVTNAIATATSPAGEKVFCGPADDPFFVDLAGAFDVGSFRPEGNATNPPKDGLARFNVHTIALKIPISALQKDGETTTQATSILDGNFVIGVWASASRQQIKTLDSGAVNYSGNWVQVSRLGMPLTNEVIVPVGEKDLWNTVHSNSMNDTLLFDEYLKNPELALYMDTSKFANAVPALNALRIQSHFVVGPYTFDFRNGKKGGYVLKGSPLLNGTALSDAAFGFFLLPDSASPRAIDLLPIFHTGVPNLIPYQLATGKSAGNPLSAGKPFINNFLPTFGDMLRLNMAVPVTPRNDPKFSSLGLVGAAVLGLTDPAYNASAALQFIPNMDGFPNGRRLEDDITTIELQAVGGVVLAAIGIPYDNAGDLNNVLTFSAGPTHNDTTFKTTFPFVQIPWRGFDYTIQPRF